MLILLTAIMNQKTVPLPGKRIHWENIIKVSEFHNIANIIYLGALGIKKEISEDETSVLYQSYKKELLLGKAYKDAREVIMWQMERHGISGLLLTDTEAYSLYPKPEMAYAKPVEFLVEKRDIPYIHRFMRDMDYEQEEDRLGNGTAYTRVPGIKVVFYDKVPVENLVFRRHFSGQLRKYPHMSGYKHIYILSREEKYLYYTGTLVEAYIRGSLRMRDILDFWLYENSPEVLKERERWKTAADVIERAKWQAFAQQIDVLCSLWFDDGTRQQYGLALELEEYIFSYCHENKHLDKELLPYERARLDFYWRSREGEWAIKKREWLFPSKEYMFQFFPVLGKYPFLLVFCWAIRDLRFLKIVCANRCRQIGFKLQVRLLDMKERLCSLMKKGGQEDLEDTIGFINKEEQKGEER